MKIILLVFVSMVLTLNIGQAARFKKIDVQGSRISVLEAIEVVSIESLCPIEDAICFIDGTAVTLEITLNGCLDELGTFSYFADYANGEINLFVSATNIGNPRSIAAFCKHDKIVEKKVTLINMYGAVNLNVLKSL